MRVGVGVRVTVTVTVPHRERGLISLARDCARPERQPKEDVEEQLVAQLGMLLQRRLQHAYLVSVSVDVDANVDVDADADAANGVSVVSVVSGSGCSGCSERSGSSV